MIIKWPNKKPDYPFDDHGWFEDCNREMLSGYLSDKTRCIIELGSWLGKSTRFMLDKAPNATLYAIDTWEGSPEFAHLDIGDRLDHALERFMANCWEYRDRIKIKKMRSIVGILACMGDFIFEEIDRPDLIYVDASHDFKDVSNDLRLIAQIFPTAQVVGDDWNWPSVKQAVIDMGREISYIDNCWAFK